MLFFSGRIIPRQVASGSVITSEEGHHDHDRDDNDHDDASYIDPDGASVPPLGAFRIRHALSPIGWLPAEFTRQIVSVNFVVSRIITCMPKLWDQTIEAHRQHVTDAILHTTVALVSENGLRAVTMSEIAERADIGRATLYKYFSDVESILIEWHERQIEAHLHQLGEVIDRPCSPAERLTTTLETYAAIALGSRGHNDSELASVMHRSHHVAKAQRRLHAMLTKVIAEAAIVGEARDDVSPKELATYCIHALEAAPRLSSKRAVTRLVEVTIDGLRGP